MENSNRIRLLYITNQISGAAGLERVLSIKASFLADNLGYDVHIITLNQGDRALFYDFSHKIQYHDLSIKGNPFKYITDYRRKIRNKVKEINPDVISVCDDGLKAFFLPLILKNHRPIIYERHVSKNIEVQTESVSLTKRIKTGITYRLMNSLGKRFDRFVVLTKDNVNEWDLPNIEVISNPLSFYPPENEVSALENKKVLAVGRQCFQKGYDRLLESWKIVQSKHPEWKLDIFGKIQTGDPYSKMTEELGIEDSVTFYPPVKDIEKQYQKASIYVMPSRFEGFGMVLIEAMAYGVPCISYNCPCGPGEIIQDGKNGFLVENDHTEQFAKMIERLIEEKELRMTMGKEARKRAKDYLPEQIVPQWHRLFTNLLAKS